jgi:hypothetical protein
MARKKSVSFSAKPVQDRTAVGDTLHLAGRLPLSGEFIPATGRSPDAPGAAPQFGLVGRGVYRTVYAVSYGFVLGAIMLGKVIPGRRYIAQGLQDGSAAARQTARAFDDRAEKARSALQESVFRA